MPLDYGGHVAQLTVPHAVPEAPLDDGPAVLGGCALGAHALAAPPAVVSAGHEGEGGLTDQTLENVLVRAPSGSGLLVVWAVIPGKRKGQY